MTITMPCGTMAAFLLPDAVMAAKAAIHGSGSIRSGVVPIPLVEPTAYEVVSFE
jgi:hypothetical protein